MHIIGCILYLLILDLLMRFAIQFLIYFGVADCAHALGFARGKFHALKPR